MTRTQAIVAPVLLLIAAGLAVGAITTLEVGRSVALMLCALAFGGMGVAAAGQTAQKTTINNSFYGDPSDLEGAEKPETLTNLTGPRRGDKHG